jgi:hypothetical protein
MGGTALFGGQISHFSDKAVSIITTALELKLMVGIKNCFYWPSSPSHPRIPRADPDATRRSVATKLFAGCVGTIKSVIRACKCV